MILDYQMKQIKIVISPIYVVKEGMFFGSNATGVKVKVTSIRLRLRDQMRLVSTYIVYIVP